MRWTVLLLCFPSLALAERPVDAIEELHAVCRSSASPGPRELYAVRVDRFRFESYDEIDSLLRVDTQRNLRAFRGSAEFFPTDFESIAFRATEERAAELRTQGHALRLGFFLGFDGGRPCVIRSVVAVTTVRADLAFVELLDQEGRVVAREDFERLRAWQDDQERDGIPGEGPRAQVDPPTGTQAAAATVLTAPSVATALGQCFAQVSLRRATAIVRLRVGVDGSVERAEMELSSLGRPSAQTCVVNELRRLRFPAGGGELRVPIRFAR